ncbi:MAG: hypothetical protein WCI74_01045, partial [Actinomycetes bacterium]
MSADQQSKGGRVIKSFSRPAIALDGSTKYVATADDGTCFELVYFPWPGEETVCMSAQAGCGYGCLHCATTFANTRFQRSLTGPEIVSAVSHVARMHGGADLVTVDFSGTGDSSRNWVNVSNGCQQMLARNLCRTVTITSVAPKNWVSRLLADDAWLPAGFLFSLHGATLAKRRSVVAFAEDPVRALPGWALVSQRCPVTLNYVMHSANTGP